MSGHVEFAITKSLASKEVKRLYAFVFEESDEQNQFLVVDLHWETSKGEIKRKVSRIPIKVLFQFEELIYSAFYKACDLEFDDFGRF